MADHEADVSAEANKAAENGIGVVPAVDVGNQNEVEAVTGTAAALGSVPSEANPTNNAVPHAALPMSKNQLKKLKKKEAYEEKKREKKEQEKRTRKEAQEIKKIRVTETLKAMSEEDLKAWRAQKAEKVAARNKEKLEKKAKMAKALESGQRIVIDLEFPHLMTEPELRSITHQVNFCYAANNRSTDPAHLILSGVHGTIKEQFAHNFPGYENWTVTTTDKSYLDHFSDSKNDLVYLTADSPHELQALDPRKIYIVGGIVDRNRHKNLCFNKAIEQGIATARLPIGENIKLASSMVMCTNHVVEIMVKWMEKRDWTAAFEAVIPTRKRKERDGAGTGGGDEQEGRKEKKEGDGDDGVGPEVVV